MARALPRPPRAHPRLALVLRAVAGALVLGFVQHWRYGYSAGNGDHRVLSAQGMHWADPTLFAGDWFLERSPQPHWLFDVVTWFGMEIGKLSTVYVGYWALSLLAFGLATALLARRWAPAHQSTATVLVCFLAGMMPWWLLGTGSPLYPNALPVVLAGCMVYLVVAALFTDHRTFAAVAAVVAAAVHLQQGMVLAILLIGLAAVRFHLGRLPGTGRRRVDRVLLLGGAGCAAVVLFGLWLRPVAGEISDFAQICTQLIPYHCEASSWSTHVVWAGMALVGLAVLSCLYFSRSTIATWAVLIALPAFGLVVGVAADRWNVPMVGELAQGLNVYRLDVVLLPMAVWGLIVPLFAPVKTWVRLIALGAVIGLGYLLAGSYTFDPRWMFERPNGGPWLLLFAGALVVGAAAMAVRARKPGWATGTNGVVHGSALAVVGAVLAAVFSAGAPPLRTFDVVYISDNDIHDWGMAVRRTLPPGAQLISPPLGQYIRMASGRGVVADCKNVPYGGDAWIEYQHRINSIGGLEQCLMKIPSVFFTLPLERYTQVAREFGADYLVVEEGMQWRIPELVAAGWTIVLEPVSKLRNTVLRAPVN
ncbi:DUF6798 domain-containing protein [Actinokineospora diospyrosa]|uniref:DUF6798 domain-containing protein n=1 Tax=Actinokineospora diospyrosa TaxID=103728 RepID=A0ABT1ID44_9PSEU|nr:DUF6798 domain-containing protein [Actinokineospora diospyrosa]MCP2270548.1 hypothetical protein [Actinokineospora diospyrosa]